MTAADFESLLRRVSRSFYLSLQVLPASIRSSLSLAYALARASDTIADSASLSASARVDILRQLPEVLPPPMEIADSAEHELLLHLPELIQRWRASPDRDLIGGVWETICTGQIFDLERFVRPGALEPDELQTYTELVAGCVGEFWTELACRQIPDYSPVPAAKLRALGRSLGCALQRVNILRDRAADAALGRVYVPEARVAAEWDLANAGLRDGERYAAAIRSRRIRFAVLLPARLGIRTLRLLKENPNAPRVKVPRREVWTIALMTWPDLLRGPK